VRIFKAVDSLPNLPKVKKKCSKKLAPVVSGADPFGINLQFFSILSTFLSFVVEKLGWINRPFYRDLLFVQKLEQNSQLFDEASPM